MYIYFDKNRTIKEVINDESIRKGSSDYNKIYCYLEGNPDIDDIWYLQKNPDGTLTNEVSFVDNIVTKSIPYDSKRDMKYFQDFEEYKFYVFTLSSSYLSQNGLVVATIRVAENNTLWALGELTFNVQANIVNSDNDITQSQYDYLLLTISSYYSKNEIDNKFAKKDGSNVDTFKANDFILDGVSLKDNLFYYSDNTDITNTLTLTNHYLDKANGNANPDSNSKCTDYIDLSTYTIFLVSGHSQYATTLICTYDENKTFLRSYGDGTSAGQTFNDYEYTPQSDEKFVRFSTYQYTQYPLKVVSLGEFLPINVKKQDNYLFKKKYVACGDSFTAGDVISSDKVYPYLIAQRNNMQLVNMAHNGSYIHYGENGFTNPNNSYYYKNIPLDADIITIAYGLNETSASIGTKESNDNTTIWGAYNEVLGWITTNIPNAKVGIISNDAWMTYELRNALQEIAYYWGVEFLDLKEYGKPFMISGKYSQDGDTNSSVVTQRTNQYCVSSTNGHPNELGHKVRSYIIENFLRGAYGVNNSYTKKEIDSALFKKADADDTYSKSQVDNLLDGKADKSDTYTRAVVDSFVLTLSTEKANKSDVYTKTEVDGKFEGAGKEFETLSNAILDLQTNVSDLKSVQNVVDVVPTYAALQKYDASKVETYDKIQVIADETHDGASTIYNRLGNAWYYVGAFGTNSYTKTEVDTKLSTKADKDDTYTKQEVNDKLDGYIKNDDTTYSATVRGKEVIVQTEGSYGSTLYQNGSIHRSVPRTAGYTYTFPEKSGTFAMTSDIPTVNDPTITFTQGGVTKGSISLNQASDQTIDLDAGGSGGGSGTITLDDIVDKNGNKRFVEGNGTPVSLSGITPTYYKWSLSGTHLMIVYSGKISSGTIIPAGQKLIDFTLPEWILNKIFPLTNKGTLDFKSIEMFTNDESRLSKVEKLIKTNTGVKIENQSSGTINSNYNFRFQFDLLIDTD